VIRRLKARFILIIMLFVTTIFLVVFSVVVISAYRSTVKNSLKVLVRLLANDPVHSDALQIPGFVVTVDGFGNAVSVAGMYYTEENKEACDLAVKQALSEGKIQGVLYRPAMRYARIPTAVGQRIAFVDRSVEIFTMRNLVLTSTLVCLGSLSAFFGLALFLSTLMVRPVDQAFRRQQQFIGDASHELKTPLTVIWANLSLIDAHPEQSVAEQARWIGNIRVEAQRMTDLVSQMLFLAKTDDRPDLYPMQPMNLSDAVWSAALPFESVLYEQGKPFYCEIENELFVFANDEQIKSLTTILLDNAGKYSGEGTAVTVRLERDKEGRAALRVHNWGVPIPPEEQSKVFRRFYRMDASRSRGEGGYGLGLSMAQRICELHEADITVESTQEGGTVFSVVFPLIHIKDGVSYPMKKRGSLRMEKCRLYQHMKKIIGR